MVSSFISDNNFQVSQNSVFRYDSEVFFHVRMNISDCILVTWLAFVIGYNCILIAVTQYMQSSLNNTCLELWVCSFFHDTGYRN